MLNTNRDPVVKLIKQSRTRATFAVATLLTCGFAAIPWIIWEIVRDKS